MVRRAGPNFTKLDPTQPEVPVIIAGMLAILLCLIMGVIGALAGRVFACAAAMEMIAQLWRSAERSEWVFVTPLPSVLHHDN
jgi:hypothetical protein